MTPADLSKAQQLARGWWAKHGKGTNMTVKPVVIGAVLVMLATSARAEIITRCGASTGYGYYFTGTVVPQSKAGWSKAEISKGEILLILAGDQPDIVFTDATGGTQSARSAGAEVMFLPAATGFKLVLLVYPKGAVDHYLFQLDHAGNGTVAWGNVKAGGLLQTSSLYVAKCLAP